MEDDQARLSPLGAPASTPEAPPTGGPRAPTLAGRVLHRWPLRYTVPIFLAIGAVLALVVTLTWSVLVVNTGVVRNGRDELRTDVDVAAHAFARHMAAGYEDVADDAVATLESDPRTTFAVVLDAEGRVLAARRPGLVGRRPSDAGVLPAGGAGSAVARALSIARERGPDAAPAVEGAPDHILVAAARVRLPAAAGGGNGTILVLHALGSRIRFERGVIVRSMAPLVVVMLLSTVALWVVFDVAVGRRLGRLAEAARRLAAGERGVQAGLVGTDEVGSLGAAFDRMATEIDARVDRGDAELALVEDRERIARDLHDHVIQRLFATGLALQSASSRVDERTADRLRGAVADLDDTIREIRTTIFGLHRHEQGVRADVVEVAAEYREVLGFLPETHFEGSVDTLVEAALRDHLVATVREALSNVARHAHARRVRVTVRVGRDVQVEVVDDGIGLPTVAVRSSGLTNLEQRAAELGGELEVVPGTPAGTVLRWRVPARPTEPATSG